MSVNTAKARAYEAYLVAAARRGDNTAFARLVAYRGPKLFAHAVRLLGHREEAADAVQESWLEISRGLGRLRADTAFAPWAYRIVTRQCARQIKRNIRSRKSVQAATEGQLLQAPPDTPDMPDGLAAAIADLPALQEATIRLFYLEEYSLQEVAQAMDVPTGTVKSRLATARARLKTYLEGKENGQY